MILANQEKIKDIICSDRTFPSLKKPSLTSFPINYYYGNHFQTLIPKYSYNYKIVLFISYFDWYKNILFNFFSYDFIIVLIF